MPNLLAYLALFLWPVVAIVLFRTQPPERAVVWTVLGGYLFVPVLPVIDFPMVPPIDKAVVASLAALFGALLVRKGWAAREAAGVPVAVAARPERGAVAHTRFARPVQEAEAASGAQAEAARGARAVPGRMAALEAPLLPLVWLVALLALTAAGTVMTVLTNGEPVPAGPFLLPGMRIYDLVSLLLAMCLSLLPFFLGWRYLGTPTGQRAVLMAFAIGGLLYAPLMLIEVRLSPQLNVWLYGFFPHSFAQHVRAGGFRPIVFLSHGLWVGIFIAMAILSALALWRLTPAGTRPFDKLRWLLLGGLLLVVLVLAKTLGALVIAVVFGAVVLFGGRRLILMVAAVVATLVLLYPMARGSGIAPVETVLNLAESVSADRAGSFRFRLENEDVLLAKANQKPLFGWGTWGRGFIYNEWGNRVSVTDGTWIILMNAFGWVGYVARFALLCVPMILLAARRTAGPETVFLAMVVAANLLDLLPNATLESITWLAAGALAGTMLPSGGMGEAAAGRRARTAPPARGAAVGTARSGMARVSRAGPERR